MSLLRTFSSCLRQSKDNIQRKRISLLHNQQLYISVMESAIKHYLYLKGKLIRHIEIPILHGPFFNDDDLNSHFNKMIKGFYRSKVSTE